jgi:nascent polypeptide-associated complex subunit alpha
VKIDPNMMRNLMKQLKMEEVPATEVVIKTESGNIVINNPSVKKMDVKGSSVFQISGEVTEEETIEVSEEDIALIKEKTGCSEDEALEALSETEGDIAAAILKLKKK